MALIVAFRVDGDAQPAGSKNAFVPTRKGTHPPEPFRDPNGRIIVNVVDSCKKSPAWKAHVGRCAKAAMKGKQPVEGRALKLVLRFVRQRPAKHFGTGRNAEVLRSDAPEHPLGTPDLTKLIRAAEDGMLGIVYKDDCLVVRQVCSKEYGAVPGVFVELWEV